MAACDKSVIEPRDPFETESETKKLSRLRKIGGVVYAKYKQAKHCVFGKE